MNEELVRILSEIAEKDGLCIWGTPELNECETMKDAFRLGSAMAFAECGRLAKEALELLVND